jgi:hypothetical protein
VFNDFLLRGGGGGQKAMQAKPKTPTPAAPSFEAMFGAPNDLAQITTHMNEVLRRGHFFDHRLKPPRSPTRSPVAARRLAAASKEGEKNGG